MQTKNRRIDKANKLLAPVIAKISSNFASANPRVTNLGAMMATDYPLMIENGEFYSEAILNSNHRQYRRWIESTLIPLRNEVALKPRGIPFEELLPIGEAIQRTDESWIRREILGEDMDSLHCCFGPDDKHPYRKIVLCRTTIPISLNGETTRAFIEKFLVVYSYWSYAEDPRGRRALTVTPLHSHPMNFEVVYFTKFDESSCVEEQEFEVRIATGLDPVDDRLIRSNQFNQSAVYKNELRREALRAVFVREETWWPSKLDEPAIRTLEPFQNDLTLAQPQFIRFTDSLFRPHRVTVSGRVDSTHYFAINNYISLNAEVFLYRDDGYLEGTWNCDDWAGKPKSVGSIIDECS